MNNRKNSQGAAVLLECASVTERHTEEWIYDGMVLNIGDPGV